MNDNIANKVATSEKPCDDIYLIENNRLLMNLNGHRIEVKEDKIEVQVLDEYSQINDVTSDFWNDNTPPKTSTDLMLILQRVSAAPTYIQPPYPTEPEDLHMDRKYPPSRFQ